MEKKREVEVQEYWQNKEQELGEPILLRSISHTYQSGGAENFGVLFASAGFLVFEYSKAGRRSILEVLFSRREQGLSEQLKIPRSSIRTLAMVPASTGKRWVARSESPQSVAERLRQGRTSLLARLLSGSALCVCTDESYLLLDTPVNREWLSLLGGKK
jgi:hypothetical protein